MDVLYQKKLHDIQGSWRILFIVGIPEPINCSRGTTILLLCNVVIALELSQEHKLLNTVFSARFTRAGYLSCSCSAHRVEGGSIARSFESEDRFKRF